MSRHSDAQKFIGQSRAPRVQIEYDVELYGSQKKVELPFVVGVMSDLSGDNSGGLGPIEDRRFVDIDADNFDRRMEQIAPALSYHIPNVLEGDGALLIGVDLTFKRLADFEPAELVKQIPELAVLLDARTRLMELVTYMDGKAAAEEVIKELLSSPRWTDAVKLAEAPTKDSMSGHVAPEKDAL